MKPSKILITLIALLFLLQCRKESDRLSIVTPPKSERDAYYERIPDAPIDLYCHLDNLLDANIRNSLCLNIQASQNGNLSLDLGIVIKDNKLDTIEVQAFYFDENGLPKRDTVATNVLLPVLNSMDLSQIQVLSHIQTSDFAIRVQWERFCIGHVQMRGTSTQSEIDSITRKHGLN